MITEYNLNGLFIDYETDITSMFVSDRQNIKTQKDLDEFQDLWSDICKEMHVIAIGRCDINSFLEIRDNQEKQNAAIEDPIKKRFLNLILPYTLLHIHNIANYYKVPTGCVFIQILNSANLKSDI